jgi:V/A-type H+-transporting ATPase subunit C
MRVRVLERNLMSLDKLDRILDAKSLDDAFKVLTECGYDESEATTASALEKCLYAEREKTYNLVENMAPKADLLDLFRTRYDYHNLKVLVKSEATGEDSIRLLLPTGRVTPDALVEAYQAQKFEVFPGQMSQVKQAREVLAATSDPQRSDFVLDQAYFADLLEISNRSKDPFLQDLVLLQIDSANLRAVVRWLRQQRDPSLMEAALIPGGSANVRDLLTLPKTGEGLSSYFSDLLDQAKTLGVEAIHNLTITLTSFEKAVDDAQVNYLRKAKYIPFGSPPILAFLAAKEAEFSAIRTALGGRIAGVSAVSIRERLRESYA